MIDRIPFEIKNIMHKIRNEGFTSYLVGGCVRDLLMDREPNDFDIASDAMPDDIIRIFGSENTCPTGIKYGTVTVFTESMQAEITRYRCDGEYSDFRTPDEVTFVDDIHADLMRRDFTINALALGIDGEIIDDFGGIEHIRSKTISCVGEPCKRFSEDALRILRAVRFASELDFEIAPETNAAMLALKDNLKKISAERINKEFVRIVCGRNSRRVLSRYSDILAVFIPEIKKSVGFEQYSPYHKYTVWEHTAKAVSKAADKPLVKLTMFFHDISKPDSFYLDETGRGHFKGHGKVGAAAAKEIMKRLKFDNKTISDVTTLIYFHSEDIESDADIKKLISKLGEELFFALLDVKRADNSAKNDFVLEELSEIDEIEKNACHIITSGECYSLRQLAVNGNDLAEIGITGRNAGVTLNTLLNLVIEGKTENTRSELISAALEILRKG